ncbi:hypothetical protein EV13_2962 [Prochlorococcus sp. MIT 0702]|nr:hypothetical protein EV12_2908 [Prochlorococcus sp. MIT 0701]KGG26181.1 hypothetical protein EV13_2962 [Prochlorococcus sp. MIT 0702]KGG33004.1 hypothetical protein EV14_1845 [Prochlorococcus sp. MIT 0703]
MIWLHSIDALQSGKRDAIASEPPCMNQRCKMHLKDVAHSQNKCFDS